MDRSRGGDPRVETAAPQRDRRARHRVSPANPDSPADRQELRERVRAALGRAEQPACPLAVLVLRVEGFDSMLRDFGRGACEAMLRIAGQRLRHRLRSGDAVGCAAADALACIVPDLSAHEPLGHLARRLSDAVAAPMVVGAFEFRLRPAIGIATSPANGTNADALLRRADTATTRARQAGTGFAFFDSSVPELSRPLSPRHAGCGPAPGLGVQQHTPATP